MVLKWRSSYILVDRSKRSSAGCVSGSRDGDCTGVFDGQLLLRMYDRNHYGFGASDDSRVRSGSITRS